MIKTVNKAKRKKDILTLLTIEWVCWKANLSVKKHYIWHGLEIEKIQFFLVLHWQFERIYLRFSLIMI